MPIIFLLLLISLRYSNYMISVYIRALVMRLSKPVTLYFAALLGKIGVISPFQLTIVACNVKLSMLKLQL